MTTIKPCRSEASGHPEPILIKNGNIVNDDGILVNHDLYLEHGFIKAIGQNIEKPNARIINAENRYIIPGGIDPHTHFEFEFMGTTSVDDFYIGTRAAIAGGTTMIIDFAFPEAGESIVDCYLDYRRKADSKVCCDYSLHVCLVSWSEEVKNEMEGLCNLYGVNSFKMFMAYNFMLSDTELYNAFYHCRNLGALAQVHAENGAIIAKNAERLLAKGVTTPKGHLLSRPEQVEAEAVNRACVIAEQVECPLYVVHVMSKSAAAALELAQKRGVKVYGETLVAGLGTDGSHYDNEDFHHAAGHVLSPPLRCDITTPAALMNYLADDVLQLTGSDNCTFSKKQKELGKNDFTKIPNGVNGVEDRLSVIWEKGVHTGIIDPKRFVAVTSSNAAKIFNMYPRKGCIAVGSDADIVVWNPQATRVISAETHHHAVDFNIFEGMECHGVPEYVIVNGRICVENGKVDVEVGSGRFLKSQVFAPYVYEKKFDDLNSLKDVKSGVISLCTSKTKHHSS